MDLKKIDAAIARYGALIDEGALPDDGSRGTKARLAFFRGIWGIQHRYAQAVAATGAPGALPDVEQLDEWYWDEQPILAHVPATVDAQMLADCVRELTGWIAENGQFDNKSILELSSCDLAALMTPECMRLAGTDPVSQLEVVRVRSGSDMVAMVFSLALRAALEPTQEAIMGRLHDRLIEENLSHRRPVRCPVCGDMATAAYVGLTEASAGNGRRLYCSQCGATWEFERIRCARCGCADSGKLHYYSVAGDAAHRLHLCEDCGEYIRTTFVDGDAPVAAIPEVEDVVMANLDALARSGAVARLAHEREEHEGDGR
ncbi:formate dehydrogenase accessory protein FdhE [bacterium]|nr:formate dehydrogenase accessory protein FdhE [bacterium]